ncbi:MAG: SufD family Fe-S cluster assembly protein, partial [Candidatus Obscuribacterales bacterium]|nr:SufD family Fe-S cluster assembly protein [Candidatus Obscuribacterales bacterium]
MAELETTNTIAKQTVEELASRLAEPTWLVDNRLSAWEAYYKTPMPTDRDEGWKRTAIGNLDPSMLRTINIPAAVEVDKVPAQASWLSAALAHFKELSGVLVQSVKKPGSFVLDKNLASKGVLFCDIATAIVKHADKIQPYLSTAANAEEDGKFTLLSRALFNCGLFLYVPKGVEINAPFFYALDLTGAKSEAVLPRTLVVAEDLSKVTLAYIIGSDSMEKKDEAPPISLLSQFVEIHVKPAAKVSYLELQQQDNEIFMINRSNCLVDRDGRYESLTLALGGCQTKSDMATVLRAPGASSEILGVVLGGGEEKFSFNTIQDHAAS